MEPAGAAVGHLVGEAVVAAAILGDPAVLAELGDGRVEDLAGLAVAAPSIVPGSALGLDAKTAPSERITVGMIGVGRQAYIVNMQRQFLKMPDVQIVAVCDVDG